MGLLITGASGQLGGHLLDELRGSAQPVVAWSGSRAGALLGFPLRPVDLADPDQTAAAFREARPKVVIHAGAVTTVAGCYRDPDHAWRINTRATEQLADLCTQTGARLLFTSTDLVFDGERGGYREEDVAAPLSVYGRTKLAAEKAVLACPRGVAVRVSLLFGPSRVGRPSFFDDQVAALRGHKPLSLFSDEWRSPLSLGSAAQALLALAATDFTGLLHLGGPERLSRLEMGQRLALVLGVDPSVLVATTRASAPAPEPRPRDASLDSSRWRALFPDLPWPTWTEALRHQF